MPSKNKIDYFTINFNNKPNPIYSPGDFLSGNVNIRLNERIKINSFKVIINGKSRVDWSKKTGNRTNSKPLSTRYSSEEIFMNINIEIIRKQADTEIYLESGEHSYEFNAILPLDLPTSFEHTNGQIRYAVFAILDIPWSSNKNIIRSFTIINPFDLNTMPNLRISLGASSTQIFGCRPCCKTYPIVSNFSVKQSGYVPGEMILFTALIDNRTNREINVINVKLIESIKLFGKETGFLPPLTQYLHSTVHTTIIEREVASTMYVGRISPNDHLKWENGKVIVPPLCPSSSNKSCGNIEVNYFLRLGYITGNDRSRDDELSIPIVIGTIPLVNVANNDVKCQPSAPPQPETSLFTFEPNLFREVSNFKEISEIKDETLDSDYNSYRPLYPYFKDFEIM